MPGSTTKGKSTDAAPAASKPSGLRMLLPAVPLAIALTHSAVTGIGSRTTGVPMQPRTTQTLSSGAPATGTNPLAGLNCGGSTPDSPRCAAPVPMLSKGHPVDWFFVFKLNTKAFPQCGNGDTRTCPFGGYQGTKGPYTSFGQQFVYASAEAPTLQDGGQECLGTSTADPVGATFDEVYNGTYHYVVWNDQPYQDPEMECGTSDSCSGPWGHSKGILAWNDAGEGLVMQVSTPDWPLSGSAQHPRKAEGNTLGCMKDDNVLVSQHFFALHLTKDDLVRVLQGLGNASVVTDPKNLQVVNNGGPSDVQALVNGLGVKSSNKTATTWTLSSGVELISKPSDLAVPPWQMVSALLGGVSLHVANWWTNPDLLASTTAANPTAMGCWNSSLAQPGPVVSATTGTWKGVSFGLLGGANPNGNHAKVAVSTSGSNPYAIFGDMNQEGSYTAGSCTKSQNGRGGTFYVVKNAQLAASVGNLIGAGAATQ
jgi:Deoxyribonuclease II